MIPGSRRSPYHARSVAARKPAGAGSSPTERRHSASTVTAGWSSGTSSGGKQMLPEPRVGAGDGRHDLLDLGLHVLVLLVRVPPHVVFDRRVVRRRARVRE